MPTLRELEAEFTKATGNGGFHRVETLAEADGVFFLCPACFVTNHGPIGTHSVIVPFTNAPAGAYSIRTADGREPRWSVSGNSLDDLQCSPSVQLLGGCNWHGWVGSSGVPPGSAA